ncbi:hypothetical protein V5P93_000094 [Actinokineospora auranticolor]|uniref:Uncharacterized protein n=1 Tax=Actinokineospora auranticolor TaxID=155976 RepID=A0A2S6GBU4_9PSEU|nr:hypothetical protein [Actinokineospora auranticolor]PPK61745.1 hypothetical protein CLV40_13942 [Actinokineospora auranticolor]
MRGLLRRRVVRVGLVVAVVALAVGLWAFEPWRLFTRSTVDEALPDAFQPPATSAPATSSSTATTATTTTTTVPTGPRVLAEGSFVSQEHPTSGVARVLE